MTLVSENTPDEYFNTSHEIRKKKLLDVRITCKKYSNKKNIEGAHSGTLKNSQIQKIKEKVDVLNSMES